MQTETRAMRGSTADRDGMASAGLVITCEHGGNRIPEPYRVLFHGHRALLDTHRGFDPGAQSMARALAAAFAAPLLVSTVSRLLVDLNRSAHHPRLHAEAIRKAPAEVRRQILKQHYQPYRAQAERLVRQAIAEHGRVIHLSSHSFTPELDGKLRNADIGLLYDPARSGEADLCERWKAALNVCAPALSVRRNYPYAGKGDGLTAWFRRCFPPDAYVGIELEINQKHVIRAGRHWAALRKVIVESLRGALASRRAGDFHVADPIPQQPKLPESVPC
jgi:predicted N-formylglutamate amidohydrolase